MDFKLEVIAIPVSDVDAAKAFYTEQVGFRLDHDVHPGGDMRVVQMTPPGSSCSVVIGDGLPLGEPGSTKGAQLVIEDVDAAREALAARGVEISDVQQLGPEGAAGSRFAFFADPDGNGWALQELRKPETAMRSIPGGKSTVTPYVAVKGATRFLDFVEQTFATPEPLRVLNQDGTIGHAEVHIGDSVVMTFDARPEWPDTPSFLSVYVQNVDEVVARALDAGATIVTEITTSRIIGDRGGRIKDPVGNIWWIQTHLEDVDEATMRERFGDPAELATMQRLQRSFDEEMTRRA